MNPKMSNLAEKARISEEQLDALREEAARTGKVQDHGIVPVASPFPKPASAASYHGNPVLKPPTWTWQVPLYFFVGGTAGMSAVIALVAHLLSKDAALVRTALWVAFAGALLSPPLLIADLGRRARFLNMLRVFKLQSAMSVGAWTLVVFSSAAGLAFICHEATLAGYGNGFLLLLEWLAQIFA